MDSFRDALASGRALKGIWLAAGSPVAAEIAALAGFDWALIDLEHGCGSETDALRMLQAMGRTPIHPVVRVPCLRRDIISRCLDFGAEGIMLPMVATAAEAAEFARALRYPPEGTRGMSSSCRAADYGLGFNAYFNGSGRAPVGIAQIETREAVANSGAIAAVDGIDVLFIGHSDLSLQLGCFRRFDAPELLAAENVVLAACERSGKAPGAILRPTMKGRSGLGERGGLFALGSDVEALKTAFSAFLQH